MITYFLSTVLLTRVLHIPLMLTAALSSVMIVALPILVVDGIIVVNRSTLRFRLALRENGIHLSQLSLLAFKWLVGTFVLIILSSACTLLFHSFLLSVVLVLFFCFASIFLRNYSPETEADVPRSMLIISGLLSMIPSLLIKFYQPFPLVRNFGSFNSNHGAMDLLINEHLDLGTWVYLPITHVLSGYPAFLYNINPFVIHWFAQLIMYASLGIGVCLFTYRLSSRWDVGIISAWVSVWIMSVDTLNDIESFIPRGMLVALWPYLLTIAYETIKDEQRILSVTSFLKICTCCCPIIIGSIWVRLFLATSDWQVLAFLLIAIFVPFLTRSFLGKRNGERFFIFSIISLGLVSFHLIEGTISFIVLLFFILGYSIAKRGEKMRVALYALPIVAFLLFLLQWLGVLSFHDNLMFSRLLFGNQFNGTYVDQGFKWKMNLLLLGNNSYILLLLFFTAGLVILKRNSIALGAIMSVSMMFFLYFLPEGHMHRIASVIPFMSYIIGFGVSEMFRVVDRLKVKIVVLNR